MYTHVDSATGSCYNGIQIEIRGFAMKLLLILFLLALLAVVGLGFYLAAYSVRIRRQSLEDALKWQSERYDISWYDELEVEDYTVSSYDGYVLHAQLLRNPAPSKRYVILSHGYTDNRFGSLKYARLYLELGFNCVLYDLRGHGQNAPTHCTYSLRERRDLCAMVDDARARWPEMSGLGLHGESLGAATTAAAMRYRPAVDFAVADCGFAEVASIMSERIGQFHLPKPLFHLARLCAKLIYGCDFNDMRPIDALPENDVPMLFVHGEADRFIPCAHSVAMRDANRGPAELLLVPHARHAQSIFADYGLYREHLLAFVNKYVE